MGKFFHKKKDKLKKKEENLGNSITHIFEQVMKDVVFVSIVRATNLQ